MRTRRVWLFSAHLLPLFARVCLVSQNNALTLTTVSMGITAAEVTVFLLMNLFVPYRLARATYQQIAQIEVNLHVFAFISLFNYLLQTNQQTTVKQIIHLYTVYSQILSCVCCLQVTDLHRLLGVGMSFWHHFAVPILFSAFWFVLFGVQLVSNVGSSSAIQEGLLLYLLTR